MILAAKGAFEDYRETYEILAREEAAMTRGELGEFIDPAHDEAIRLYEQMLDRDRPVIAAALKGVITGDVYRGEDNAWKTKGDGPDSRDLNRVLPKIEKEMEDLERWWSAFRQGRKES